MPAPPSCGPHASLISRNQLCSCGSGKRFKHCHGAVANGRGGTDLSLSPEVALNEALRQQLDGHLEAAEVLYQQALAAMPEHFDALHMMGVVKLQLGKSEQALPYLLSALRLAPGNSVAKCRHNVGLCLVGVARQRGILDALKQPPAADLTSPFGRASMFPPGDQSARGRVSVILTGFDLVEIRQSLATVQLQQWRDIEVLTVIARGNELEPQLRSLLEACAVPCRLIVSEDALDWMDQIEAAVVAATGDILCFLRAGDRWGSRWLSHVALALRAGAAQWAFGGMRVVADDGSIIRFGQLPDVDALLRALDAMYLHRTVSLAFASFNPIAGGSNLMVRRDFWQHEGRLARDAPDPLLEWAWRVARDYEPAYVDEPDYLISPSAVPGHLHQQFLTMVAGTERSELTGDMTNPCLKRGLAEFWRRQWRQVAASRIETLPDGVLLACAAMLGTSGIGRGTPP